MSPLQNNSSNPTIQSPVSAYTEQWQLIPSPCSICYDNTGILGKMICCGAVIHLECLDKNFKISNTDKCWHCQKKISNITSGQTTKFDPQEQQELTENWDASDRASHILDSIGRENTKKMIDENQTVLFAKKIYTNAISLQLTPALLNKIAQSIFLTIAPEIDDKLKDEFIKELFRKFGLTMPSAPIHQRIASITLHGINPEGQSSSISSSSISSSSSSSMHSEDLIKNLADIFLSHNDISEVQIMLKENWKEMFAKALRASLEINKDELLKISREDLIKVFRRIICVAHPFMAPFDQDEFLNIIFDYISPGNTIIDVQLQKILDQFFLEFADMNINKSLEECIETFYHNVKVLSISPAKVNKALVIEFLRVEIYLNPKKKNELSDYLF